MFRALRKDGAIQVVWVPPVRSRGDGFVQVGKWFQLGFITLARPVMLVTLKIRRLDQLLLLLVSGGGEPPGMFPVQFCKSEYARISVRPTWHGNK
jgi:hypothetical protein